MLTLGICTHLCRWTLEKAGPAFIKVGAGRQSIASPAGQPCRPCPASPPSNLLVIHGQSRAVCIATHLAHLRSLRVCSGASGRPRGTTSSRPTFARSWSSCTRRSAIASFQRGCITDCSSAARATAERNRYPWLCASLIAANSSAPLPCRHPPMRRCSPSWQCRSRLGSTWPTCSARWVARLARQDGSFHGQPDACSEPHLLAGAGSLCRPPVGCKQNHCTMPTLKLASLCPPRAPQFDAEPVASGSIGQIHRAVLSDTGARLTGMEPGAHPALTCVAPAEIACARYAGFAGCVSSRCSGMEAGALPVTGLLQCGSLAALAPGPCQHQRVMCQLSRCLPSTRRLIGSVLCLASRWPPQAPRWR